MDLSSGLVSYNGWTNSLTTRAGAPSDGWQILRANVSPIGVTQYLDKKALQDGMDANDVYENARQINLIVGVYGSTKGSFWDNLQTLLSAFNPTIAYNADTANVGFVALDFFQPTADISTWPTSTYPNGIPLRFYARPNGTPSYEVDKARTSGDDGKGLSGQANINLICRDPRKYLQTTTSKNLGTGATATSNRGDYYTYPIFTFSLSAAGSSSLVITGPGNELTFTVDLSSLSSGSYTIDIGARTFLKSTGTNEIGLITSATYAPIPPGDSSGRINNSTGLTSGTMTVTYREAWA